MIVSIIGWYGTETMGDRAILDGILCVLNKVDKDLNIKIGSLYPFYTERTLLEEHEIYQNSAPNARISLFDNKVKKIRKKEIESSDLVIVGGGPLMDLEELYIIEDCFKIARKKDILTFVMGCGIGPLKNQQYIDVVDRIFELSTAISFRDNLSINTAKQLYGDKYRFKCLGDPAVISIEAYKQSHNKDNTIHKYASVNLREYPKSEYGGENGISYPELICFIEELGRSYETVYLVPMHTFFIGGDDRKILSEVAFDCNMKNVKVIQKPMNLYELYKNYSDASACVGMRYHSVVMQTILNGNNAILNYTDPKNGKIQGFINNIKGEQFYSDRIVNVQEIVAAKKFKELKTELDKNVSFKYNSNNMKEDYIDWICEFTKTKYN